MKRSCSLCYYSNIKSVTCDYCKNFSEFCTHEMIVTKSACYTCKHKDQDFPHPLNPNERFFTGGCPMHERMR